MLFITRSFTIVSLLFVATISALPASTVVDREAGSADWKRDSPDKFAADVLSGLKREAGSVDWKRDPEEFAADVLSGLKREAGSVDWKREAGTSGGARDWKREAGGSRDW